MQRRDSSNVGSEFGHGSSHCCPINVASLHLDEMSAEGQFIIETGVRRVCVDEHPGYLPGFEMSEHLAVYGMGCCIYESRLQDSRRVPRWRFGVGGGKLYGSDGP